MAPTYKAKETREACLACNHWGSHKDEKTGLCVDCWRVAVLMPWALTDAQLHPGRVNGAAPLVPMAFR